MTVTFSSTSKLLVEEGATDVAVVKGATDAVVVVDDVSILMPAVVGRNKAATIVPAVASITTLYN